MTDHPCNCSTCNKRKTMDCPIQGEEVYYKVKEYVTVPTGWETVTSVVGCLSHPDARAYLMRDVIEELERRIRLLDDFIERVPEYRDAARNTGYKECVKIIRGGVKKYD